MSSIVLQDAQQTQRRSACDRCRSHKLRCERDALGQNCNRCVRAKAHCNTSDAGKPGRPPYLFGTKRRRPSLDEHIVHVTESGGSRVELPGIPTPPSENANLLENSTSSLLLEQHRSVGSDRTTDNSLFDDFWIGGFLQDAVLPDLVPVNLNGTEMVAVSTTNDNISQEDCLRRLAALHSSVLEDITTIKSYKTIDKCPGATSGSMQNSNFMIGRMLSHADTFISILNLLASRPLSTPNTDTSTERSGPEANFNREKVPQCDVPTRISILSCYICIVRIYRTALGCICDSVLLAQKFGVSLPPIFPGLNLGGFLLDHRPLFHLHILAQLSEDMLNKMDAALGLGDKTSSQGLNVLEKSSATALLNMMLQEEAAEVPPSDEGLALCDSVKTVIARLKDLAR